MKNLYGMFAIIVFLFPSSVYSQGDTSGITLISATEKEIVLELEAPEFKVNEQQHGGILYHQVTIYSFGLTDEVGMPQVPVKGTLIGLPPEGAFTLEILGESFQTFSGYYLYPSPNLFIDPESRMIQQGFSIDPVTYATDEFYPASIVEEGFSGYMRDQRVAQLLLYPVRFNPVTREIKVYKSIRIKVSFEQPFPAKLDQPFTGIETTHIPALNPYEQLVQDLLLNSSSHSRGN